MEVRQREVVELQSQVKALGQEVKDTEEVDGRRQVVEKKFQELLDPLRRRRNFLVASREVHQFNRDVEDEIVRRTGPETRTDPDTRSEVYYCTVCRILFNRTEYGQYEYFILVLLSVLFSSCGSRRGCLWPCPPTMDTIYRLSSSSSRRTR